MPFAQGHQQQRLGVNWGEILKAGGIPEPPGREELILRMKWEVSSMTGSTITGCNITRTTRCGYSIQGTVSHVMTRCTEVMNLIVRNT